MGVNAPEFIGFEIGAASLILNADGSIDIEGDIVIPTDNLSVVDLEVTGEAEIADAEITGSLTVGNGLATEGDTFLAVDPGDLLAFFDGAGVTQPDITGARDDPESALANLLTGLASTGLILDSTTAT